MNMIVYRTCRAPSGAVRRTAFTLVELLTVMAIIGLLVAILVPALQSARAQAKGAETRSLVKAVGDGLEMFRTENEVEREYFATGGFPPSAAGDDPTELGTQILYGAHWLARHLLGKDSEGFVPRRYVPDALLDEDNNDSEQVDWYKLDAHNGKRLERVGPYFPRTRDKIVATRDLPGAPLDDPDGAGLEQPVLVDSFGNPILYFAANVKAAGHVSAPMARFAREDVLAGDRAPIYSFSDNALFTGHCLGAWDAEACREGWDLGDGVHPIRFFGADDPPVAETFGEDNPEHLQNRKTFPYYILDRDIYRNTAAQRGSASKAALVPHHKERFLLITAGRDGVYGTRDDLNNFPLK